MISSTFRYDIHEIVLIEFSLFRFVFLEEKQNYFWKKIQQTAFNKSALKREKRQEMCDWKLIWIEIYYLHEPLGRFEKAFQ